MKPIAASLRPSAKFTRSVYPPPEALLEPLGRTDALEPAMHHDSDPRTQQLSLIHGVCGQKHRAVSLGVRQHAPQLPPRERIEPHRHFVHEDDPRASKEGDRDAQAALHPAAEGPHVMGGFGANAPYGLVYVRSYSLASP